MARPHGRPRRAALGFILFTLLIDTIGFGLIIPIVPGLIEELTGGNVVHAAVWGGWLMFTYATAQFLCAPLAGNLSDRFGRRPVLLCSLAALGLDYVFMALAPSVTWLFVGRLIAGIAGSSSTTAQAYVADVTPRDERARAFGFISAAWGFGFVIGPVIGGLLGELGPRVPFWVAAAMSGLNLLYGLFVLPESLPPEGRRAFSVARANPVGAARHLARHPALLPILGVYFLYMVGHDTNPAIWTYATMDRFGWGAAEVGLSLGLVGVISVIVMAGLVKPVTARLGESRTVVIGMALMAAGFCGFAFAKTQWLMLAMILPYCTGALASPALRALGANRVGDDEQGALQGAFASTSSLSSIISPPVMTMVFGWFAAEDALLPFPGAPFLLAALLVTLGLFAFRRIGTPKGATA
jgi:DHA1 family tetracycline resistance protein-like MFS transporter